MTLFLSEQHWDTDSVAVFQQKRDEQRLKKGLPAFSSLEPSEKAEALEEEKKSVNEYHLLNWPNK